MKGRIFILLLAALLASSCCKDNPERPRRYDKVMILYSAGCNSLSSDLAKDISTLKQNYLPAKGDKKAVVVISHQPKYRGSYEEPSDSYVIRLYRKGGATVADTLHTYTDGLCLTQSEALNRTLSYVKKVFKTEHYGMIFSSHGTGWLPGGYYDTPVPPNSGGSVLGAPARQFDYPAGAYPYFEREVVPGEPMVKSVGQESAYVNGRMVSYELTVEEFASNIPMKLDYLLFDACLMGCVEVAYELKDIAKYIGFSPAEVLQYGFDYTTLASHLLEGMTSPEKVCEDFYNKYDKEPDGVMRSATISYVDCSRLDYLAQVCKELILNYRDRIAALNPSKVQQYYRSYHHWYYDLKDIMLKAGISDTEKTRLEAALDDCVVYKAATPQFWGNNGFDIVTYSGLSMYLPCNGDSYLDSQYKSLAWNKAVGLVQ